MRILPMYIFRVRTAKGMKYQECHMKTSRGTRSVSYPTEKEKKTLTDGEPEAVVDQMGR